MPHVTSVGLDVHARSVSAAAFDILTGEVTERRFGPEAGPIAEWILSFESPRAVYESGPTGFALCRELRALDDARGNVGRQRGGPGSPR